MDIDKLVKFATTGERSKSGLDLAAGFPRYEKPARQWFNYLFHEFTEKINVLVDAVNLINNTPNEPFAIGDVYITTISHEDAAAVAAHHGYGVWERYSEGRVLVGYSTLSGSPTWTKTIGSTFGEYDHTLTLEESAPHSHSLKHGRDNGSTDNDAGTVASDTGNWSGQYIPLPNVSTEGGGQPHNITQPSLVAQFWLRKS